MDVYNRGLWEFDEEAQEYFTRTTGMGIFGTVETESLYDENQALLFGRADGVYIALRASLLNHRGENAAKYPYLVSFYLQTYLFNFVAPDFVSILLFCQEFRQLVSDQNALLKP